MTKRLLILIMALLLVCASCLADEQVVVDSFKVHVQDIMQPVLATYKKDAVHIRYFDPSKHGLQGSGHWFKVRNLEPVYSLDVKKNDSVMYPYIGILDVERYTEIFTGSYPTKEEASKAEKSYLLMLCSTGAFTMAIRTGNGRKQRLNFTEILKKDL